MLRLNVTSHVHFTHSVKMSYVRYVKAYSS